MFYINNLKPWKLLYEIKGQVQALQIETTDNASGIQGVLSVVCSSQARQFFCFRAGLCSRYYLRQA